MILFGARGRSNFYGAWQRRVGPGIAMKNRHGLSNLGRGIKGAVLAVATVGLVMACQTAARPNPTPTVEKTFPTPPPVISQAATTPTSVAEVRATPPTSGAQTGSGQWGTGDSSKGRTIFQGRCQACHPNGDAGVGPSLKGYAGRAAASEFAQTVRMGRGAMPPVPSSQHSNAELADLAAFIATLK